MTSVAISDIKPTGSSYAVRLAASNEPYLLTTAHSHALSAIFSAHFTVLASIQIIPHLSILLCSLAFISSSVLPRNSLPRNLAAFTHAPVTIHHNHLAVWIGLVIILPTSLIMFTADFHTLPANHHTLASSTLFGSSFQNTW